MYRPTEQNKEARNKHLHIQSSLVITERKIKPQILLHNHQNVFFQNKQKKNTTTTTENTVCGRCAETGVLAHCKEQHKTAQSVRKTVQLLPTRPDTESPQDFPASLPGTHSKELKALKHRYSYNHVHTRVAHNSQRGEATLPSSTDD